MLRPLPGGARAGAPFQSIEQIEAANRAAGHHFFDPQTIRFFNSTIYPRIYGGRYFITAEFYDEDHPEGFTVRLARADGQINDVGDFQSNTSYEQAEDNLIDALASGRVETRFDPYEDASELSEAEASPRHFHWRTYLGELAVGVRTTRAAADRLTTELG